MSADAEAGDFLLVMEQSGAKVARLRPAALAAETWPHVQSQLRRLLDTSPGGMVVDCRALPAESADTVGPLLYELLVQGRRRSSRIDVAAVGRADQSTGNGGTLLLPPRFETVEVAVATLDARRGEAIPVKLRSGQVSDDVVLIGPRRYHFWHTFIGQSLLTFVVLGFTGTLVAYSAVVSFRSTALPMRRIGMRELDPDVALRGRVLSIQGATGTADGGAVVIAWPDKLPVAKFRLTEEDLFGSRILPQERDLLLARVDDDGHYYLYRNPSPEGRGTLSNFLVLAVSKNLRRSESPPETDLERLAQYFVEPAKLLGDREYELQLVLLSGNEAADHTFLLRPRTGRDAPPAADTDDDAAQQPTDDRELPK